VSARPKWLLSVAMFELPAAPAVRAPAEPIGTGDGEVAGDRPCARRAVSPRARVNGPWRMLPWAIPHTRHSDASRVTRPLERRIVKNK
jgi:hypothetical protein